MFFFSKTHFQILKESGANTRISRSRPTPLWWFIFQERRTTDSNGIYFFIGELLTFQPTEYVDLFPTLIEAATGEKMPLCPKDSSNIAFRDCNRPVSTCWESRFCATKPGCSCPFHRDSETKSAPALSRSMNFLLLTNLLIIFPKTESGKYIILYHCRQWDFRKM